MSSDGARAVVLYRRGRRWDGRKALGEQEAILDHIRFLSELHRRGDLERAGPFYRLDESVPGDHVGLVVHRGTAEDARERALGDPGVRAGTLEFDAFDWHA